MVPALFNHHQVKDDEVATLGRKKSEFKFRILVSGTAKVDCLILSRAG
jgi:hypothetical protein